MTCTAFRDFQTKYADAPSFSYKLDEKRRFFSRMHIYTAKGIVNGNSPLNEMTLTEQFEDPIYASQRALIIGMSLTGVVVLGLLCFLAVKIVIPVI